MTIMLKTLYQTIFSESVLRKTLYVVAIIGIVMVTMKVVNGTITTRQYNYGDEFTRKFERSIGL